MRTVLHSNCLVLHAYKKSFMEKNLKRRDFISRLSLGLTASVLTPISNFAASMKHTSSQKLKSMNPIISIKPLGFQWETADPFLFCVHHEDKFPRGNDVMGPELRLEHVFFGDLGLGLQPRELAQCEPSTGPCHPPGSKPRRSSPGSACGRSEDEAATGRRSDGVTR